MTDSVNNKTTVRIYGQEYTFSSAKSRERIVTVANHVDEVIRNLAGQGADGSLARLSILAAINITDELFDERDSQVDGDREKEQLHKDILHYQQLWEEAKRSHLQYKEDARAIQDQKDGLQERLNAKTIEVDNLIRNAEERDNVIRRLEAEIGAATDKLRSISDKRQEGSELINELKDKLKEIEGNYFELQMENIQMKGDLENYRNNS